MNSLRTLSPKTLVILSLLAFGSLGLNGCSKADEPEAVDTTSEGAVVTDTAVDDTAVAVAEEDVAEATAE